MRVRGVLLGLLACLCVCGSARAQGLTVTATQSLTPRLTQYTATSDALGRSDQRPRPAPRGLRGRTHEALPGAAAAARLL